MIAEMVCAYLWGGRAVVRTWDKAHWRCHRADARLLGIEAPE